MAALDGFGLSGASAGDRRGGRDRPLSARDVRHRRAQAGGHGAIPSLRPAGAGLEHLDRIAYYEQQDAMILDQVTARNLELVEPAAGDDASATLRAGHRRDGNRHGRAAAAQLDSAAGDFARERSKSGSTRSQNLKSRTVAREEIRSELEGILDLERLTSRITLGVATPRDLLALRGSLEKFRDCAR